MSFDKPDLRIFIRDWSPGYLDVPEEDTLPAGATPDAANGWLINISPGGGKRSAVLAKRPGDRLINPTAMAAGASVDGLFEFRRAGQPRELLGVCDGKLFVYDDVDTFTQVGATSPFTAGTPTRALFHRDSAYLFDGTVNRRYDGTALSTLGQVAPTSVTNMTAVAPSGAGVTGDYEARYSWYSTTKVHESSLTTDNTAVLTATADARRHTKPGGAPDAAYDQWRIYVRRRDTNETKFTRVATVPVGTATYTEEVIDDVRRDLAAGDQEDDPPPGAFALLEEFAGYFIGALSGSSEFYVSKAGEPESWHPRNKFAVRKGDGEALSGFKRFGEDVFIQKPHATWRLVGDRVPFAIRRVHSSYGGVGAKSGMEIDGRFFDWDRERGPYVTDGVSWMPLVDGRVRGLVATANRNVLHTVECLHIEGQGLVGWAFARQGSTRKRTLLWYSYLLDCWLPPWTGLEYVSLSPYTDVDGDTGYYVGDEWGRVFQLLSGDREGVPTTTPMTTLIATVTGATSGTVAASDATFYTDGSGLTGLPVAVRSPAGVWQWRRVASNTATEITLDTVNDAPWSTVPSAGWEVVVGGLQWFNWLPWLDGDKPDKAKVWHWLCLQGKATSSDHLIDVSARFNDNEGVSDNATYSFTTGLVAGVWGGPQSLWGRSLWGALSRRMRKTRIDRTAFTLQLRLANFYPDQPVTITALVLTADVSDRMVPSE
jgi:hypothetical protein